MRIATWNINSVRLRLDLLLSYLKDVQPDVLCLQEIKCLAEQFPSDAIADAGYNAIVVGQKSYNGVAILSRRPIETVLTALPGDETDLQARYIEALCPAGDTVVRVIGLYLPNGNPVPSEKYSYKLAFMDRLAAHAQRLLAYEEPLVICGDFNVIPQPEDVADPVAFTHDALFLPETRRRFRALMALGFTDALRSVSDAGGLYTFWDYQAGAWQRNMGLRIDHLLLSPQAADKLRGVTIDKDMRAREKPSDHVPIRIDLDFPIA